MLLHQYSPSEIIISDTSSESPMVTNIAEEFEGVQIIETQRKFFNEERGIFLLNKYATKESKSLLEMTSSDSSKYDLIVFVKALKLFVLLLRGCTFEICRTNPMYCFCRGFFKCGD